MLKVAVDCRFSTFPAGLGTYTRNLVSALVKNVESIELVLLVKSKNEDWLNMLDGKCELVEVNIPHYSISEQIKLPNIIKNLNVDLYYSPHFNVPYFCPVPFVFTLHDLILHKYPNQASLIKRIIYRMLLKRAVKKSKAIVAVSNFTKSEILETYGKSIENKVHHISEGVDEIFVPASKENINNVREKYNLKNPYFMYIGNAKEHKNLPVLISSFNKSNLINTDLILVCSDPLINKLSVPDNVKILSDIKDIDLPALYSGANAFVTASLYEGFCLPIVEALACNCFVIASNTTAIKELASPGIILVEPTEEAFLSAFSKFIRPSSIKSININWEDSANSLISVIKEIMNV